MDPDIPALIVKIINTSPKKDCYDDDGNTHLHHLVNSGNPFLVKEYIIKILNDNNKNNILNKKNNNGDTPLHIAVRNNLQSIAHLLVQAGANMEVTNRNNKKIKYIDDNNNDIHKHVLDDGWGEIFELRGGGKKSKKKYYGRRKL